MGTVVESMAIIRPAAGLIGHLQYHASFQLRLILYATPLIVHILSLPLVMDPVNAMNPVLAPYLPQAPPPSSAAADDAGINATPTAFTNSSTNNMSREDTIRVCTASQRDHSLKPQCEQALYSNVGLSLDAYTLALTQRFSFCLNDPIQDRNATFGFGGNLTFLSDCFAKTTGLMMQYMCSGAEVRAFVGSLVGLIQAGGNAAAYARMADSINCNQSRWSQGCEPGWAKSMREIVTNASSQLYEDDNSRTIPLRTDLADLPCCDGFFCPRGLGCMMPCPLGAQCTRTSLVGGLCAPYDYPLTPGVGYSCGGANLWASLSVSTGLFCPAGSYCPSTTDIRPCDRGYFCRQGSTVQTKCFQLANCGEQSTTQHLQTYGVILTLGLASIIVLAYNCSNWIRKVRRKREEKVREKAIRQVKESASAAKKWRSAASVVKKLGRTISGVARSSSTHVQQQPQQQTMMMTGKNIMMQQLRSERAAISNYSRSQSTINVQIGEVEGDQSSSSSSRRMSSARGSGPVDIQELQELYEGAASSTSDHAGDHQAAPSAAAGSAAAGYSSPNIAARPPAARWSSKLHTRSQILRYAYGQIEIEKAMMQQNKATTWKELLEVAAGSRDQQRRLLISGNERLRIEIRFQDLSLYLKSNGKKILCNVTGKLSPGRVTAVMGPSGAGKTTFLNALAGKAYNSYTSGTILINGTPNPIQCYKKVIGFVAQDDIVHGNLTVEENLWFSARYRLPAGMLKAERVLVVERIIDALGLEQIRSSKVGTVEKRGISGGQRKRVNVGLEMVMEPSLLILDEPTSGLDSTSSFLVLRALRREAQAGVNVGVVLHQPSYGLFRMFDDVMFLAKGGRTVYLGPVDQVEEYFAGMNIVVPERINPPDHFMDVLEGITRPGERRCVDPATLPLKWIHHNGYDVPPDLQLPIGHLQNHHQHQQYYSATTSRSRTLLAEHSTFTHCFRFLLLPASGHILRLSSHWDDLRSTFARYEDLSERTTPGFFGQFKMIICRVALQRIREARLQMQDYFILLLCGTCLGAIVPATDASLGSSSYAFVIIAVSLLCMVASLRTFNNEKLQYWRESASGINRVAYFLAKDAIDLFNVALKPVVFLCMFYFFNNTRSTFGENYVVTLALIYCVTGIAYIFAVLMDAGPAQLWSVFLPIVATLLATKQSLPEVIEFVRYANYAHWALQAYVIANAKRYAGVWIITRCALLYSTNYDIKHWTLCLVMLIAMGFLTRFIALLCLILCNRRRQQ